MDKKMYNKYSSVVLIIYMYKFTSGWLVAAFQRSCQNQSCIHHRRSNLLSTDKSDKYFMKCITCVFTFAVFTSDDHFVTVLQELPRRSVFHSNGLRALPAQLQHRTVRVSRLKRYSLIY